MLAPDVELMNLMKMVATTKGEPEPEPESESEPELELELELGWEP